MADKSILSLCVVCLLGLIDGATGAAHAQNFESELQAKTAFRRENAECDVADLQVARLGASARAASRWREILMVAGKVEGCGGGNNWGTSVAFYDVGGGAATPVPHRPIGFAGVDSIQPTQVAGVPAISVIGRTWGSDDAHCCPTQGEEVRFWVEAEGVVWRVMRTWRASN